MHLYHHPYSSNARRVTMTAIHLGIALELTEVNLGSADDRRRLNEINDNGKIPVLVDEGFVLWESCAIMQYLADSKAGQTLYPQDPLARADVNRWMFWACQHFTEAVSMLVWEGVWKKLVEGGDPDPAVVARGAAALARLAAVLDRHLADRRWIVGDSLTLADYAIAPPLMYKELARLPIDGYPHLLAWFARIEELPAWRLTMPPPMVKPA